MKTRSLLRDDVQTIHQQTEQDSEDQFMSRGDSQLLHQHLSTLTDIMDSAVATPPGQVIMQQPSSSGHDYINQEVVDRVLNETEGK